jgi:hypothetical protein
MQEEAQNAPVLQKETYVRWYDRYNYVRELINQSEHMPEEVQICLGKNLMFSIKSYITFLHKYSGFKKLESKIFWNLYLGNKQIKRWYDKVPQIGKAYNLLIIMPDNVMFFLNDRTGKLLEFMRAQESLVGDNFPNVERQIEEQLKLTLEQLMEIKENMGSLDSPLDKEDFNIQTTLEDMLQQWMSNRQS